jgi:hypothetical protein
MDEPFQAMAERSFNILVQSLSQVFIQYRDTICFRKFASDLDSRPKADEAAFSFTLEVPLFEAVIDIARPANFQNCRLPQLRVICVTTLSDAMNKPGLTQVST